MSSPRPARSRGYAPLHSSPENTALVRSIVARAAAAGPGSVAVFDLDGCLFDTRPRQVRIFREYAAKVGFPALHRVTEEHFLTWDLRTAMRLAGISEDDVLAHSAPLRDFWLERFFKSEYVEVDHPLPGAPDLVRAVHATGVDVVYLTGRDESMRKGTENALRSFSFPIGGPRSAALLKPSASQDDTAFKESAIEALARIGEVIIYVDNEPANVNVFHAHHPRALVVFFETDHSPRPDVPAPGIPWLRSFFVG